MNVVLARGTWYFERKPLLLSAWSTDLGVVKNESIPLWVRFKNLPDYYWTREGLSCVASSVGRPIGADKTTSLLNPVQYAKMCVRYKIGDPLPEKIKVALLDTNTLELSKSDFAEIDVSYPQRPLICSGCNSLGHLVGACPTVKRIWVQKSVQEVPCNAGKEATGSSPAQETAPNASATAEIISKKAGEETGPSVMNNKDLTVDEGWTTVVGRKSSPKKNCATDIGTSAAQMPIYSTLAKSLSKGQLKRARKVGGRDSPKKK